MDISLYTLEQLTGHAKAPPPVMLNPFLPVSWVSNTVELLPNHPGWAIAGAAGHEKDKNKVLLKKMDSGWECLGWWIGDTLAIDEDYCRAGLGTALFLETIKNRADRLPVSNDFSLGGYRLVRKALKLATEAKAKEQSAAAKAGNTNTP